MTTIQVDAKSNGEWTIHLHYGWYHWDVVNEEIDYAPIGTRKDEYQLDIEYGPVKTHAKLQKVHESESEFSREAILDYKQVESWDEKQTQDLLGLIRKPDKDTSMKLPLEGDWRHELSACLIELDKAIKLGGMEDEVKQVERQMSELKMQE